MGLTELTAEQRELLKINYYSDKHQSISMTEMLGIDDLVSDEELERVYGGINFVEEDFLC